MEFFIWLINSGVLTSLLLPHLSSSLTDSLPSLNLLCLSKTDARFMQDAPKAVWSIPYISVAFFPSLKQNFIAYRSSKVSSRPDCIFEIHQLWQSGFSRVYSNSCCSCSFEPEIIKIDQSSYKMSSNNILNFQESTSISNACTKKVWKLIEGTSNFSLISKPSGDRSKGANNNCYPSHFHVLVFFRFLARSRYLSVFSLSIIFSPWFVRMAKSTWWQSC